MLYGMLTPTDGTGFILGKDILNDMDSIRKDIGVCPQHDILYDQLTVREHLEVFG
jgi:ATP-binding cassette subfamily A (ABC1) protein 3